MERSRFAGVRQSLIGATPGNAVWRMDHAARSPESQGGGKGVDLCPRLRRRPMQEIAREPLPRLKQKKIRQRANSLPECGYRTYHSVDAW